MPSCDEVSKKKYRSWCSEVHTYLKPKQIKLTEFIKHVLILCQKFYMHSVYIIVYNPNVSIRLFCFYKDSNHDILTTSLNFSSVKTSAREKERDKLKKISSIPYALYHIPSSLSALVHVFWTRWDSNRKLVLYRPLPATFLCLSPSSDPSSRGCIAPKFKIVNSQLHEPLFI